MRLRLAHVRIPPQTTSVDLMTELHNDLKTDAQVLGNLGTYTVGLANDTISIPAEANQHVPTDLGADKNGFSVKITKVNPAGAGGIICTITGHCGTGKNHRQKSVRLHFLRQELPSTVFSKAIAAQGRVSIMKGIVGGEGVPDTIASVMSTRTTSPAVAISGGTLGGNIAVIAASLASVTGGSVHGETDPTVIQNNHVNVVDPPEFPSVDTTVFAPYATNTYVSGMSTLQNVRIPAGTGTTGSPLILAGHTTVQGILYIESPNVVHFGGNATIEGLIVFENKGTSADNALRFGGNATISPVPADPMFNAVRSITGVAIMAPTASMTTTGSTDSYFKGNVILGNFTEMGSATIKMDAGSIVTMDTGDSATFNGKDVRFMSTGMLNPPSMGVKYRAKFIPDNGTYGEIN